MKLKLIPHAKYANLTNPIPQNSRQMLFRNAKSNSYNKIRKLIQKLKMAASEEGYHTKTRTKVKVGARVMFSSVI